MADEQVKPGDETLSAAFEQLTRDGAAWASAEKELLQANVKEVVWRVELAAILIVGAVLVTFAATVTFANMLVTLLAPALGEVLAGLAVALVLFIAAGLLIFWVKSLLPAGKLGGRTLTGAKVIWSALNESH